MAQGRRGDVRLGLTLAGAISLGAYEGGVLAALLAAVQSANEREPGRLRIDALAGASAGSITAVLAARALIAGIDPIETMYGAWVRTPQIEELRDKWRSPLSTETTRSGAIDLLNGEPHPERAQTAPIRIHMALACLRGLDYKIGRIGGPPVSAGTHLDWSQWVVDGSKDVDWYVAENGPVASALASGAHAAAFPPIGLDRSAPDIMDGYRRNRIDEERFPPSKFLWYTDGGTIDNEPLGRALDMTEDIDGPAGDPLGEACRLHLMITPDPARPTTGDDRWSTRTQEPTWTATGLRTLKLLRVQHLYDDLRRLEKTNSRIAWLQKVEATLLAIANGEVSDPETALRETSEEIRQQRAELTGPGDLRPDDGVTQRVAAVDRAGVSDALHEALGLATGLAHKRDVSVAVISPNVLPEAVAGKAPRELLAGDFLGHFGGFLNVDLRESDFALGYRCTLRWLEDGGLDRHGLSAELSEHALAGAVKTRNDWQREYGAWREDMGDQAFDSRPWKERIQVYLLALRAAVIAFRSVKRGL